MPTARPRHQVTESDELAEALDTAAAWWPELSRAQLLVRLALHGHEVARAERVRRRSDRLDAIRRHSGVLTGAYPTGYLQGLREEWPT